MTSPSGTAFSKKLEFVLWSGLIFIFHWYGVLQGFHKFSVFHYLYSVIFSLNLGRICNSCCDVLGVSKINEIVEIRQREGGERG
jgi:hypothetical protein